MGTIICKLTGREGKPVKAHIIPKAFYELPPQKKGSNLLLSNVSGTFPKKLPVGIYDSTIVTKDGENIFDPLDDYAVQLLLHNNAKFNTVSKDGDIAGWQITKYDYDKLKLFSLSILWRANASSHDAFSKVRLGPHEKIIRKMLLENKAGTADEYSVILSKWIDDGFGPVFMDPFRERYDGLNYYRVYCGRYVFTIKVDRQSTNGGFREIQIDPNKPLLIVARHLKQSKEWPVMQKIAGQNAR